MKSTKKLLIATLLLVLALTAVVSSTFAWFTMQANPQIDNIQVQVTAGEGLRMSIQDKEGTYKSIWTEEEFWTEVKKIYTIDKLKLDSVTPSVKIEKVGETEPIDTAFFNLNSFQKLQYNTAVGEAKSYYSYQPAVKNEDYLSFELWFEADRAINVYLENGKVSVNTGTNYSVESARIGFVNYDTTGNIAKEFNIFNPHLNSGGFGNGDFFAYDTIQNNFREMAVTDKGKELLTLAGEGTTESPYYYTLAETLREKLNKDSTFANPGISGEKVLFSVPDKDTKVKLTVHIWLEGWDGDCIDAAKGSVMDIFLRFVGQAIEA